MSGPLEVFASGFVAELARLGYRRGAGDRAAARVPARTGCRAAGSPRLAAGAVEMLLVDCREYLAVARGLTVDTIEGYVLAVRPFLDGRLRDGDELDVARLSGGCRGVRR